LWISPAEQFLENEDTDNYLSSQNTEKMIESQMRKGYTAILSGATCSWEAKSKDGSTARTARQGVSKWAEG